MQNAVEQIERDLKTLSARDLFRVRNLVDSLLEKKDVELRRDNNLERLQKFLSTISSGSKVVRGRVAKRESSGNIYLKTFIPDSRDNTNLLLNWSENYKPISLKKSYRYLAIIKNTGKLGWAKVNKTRITRFEQSFSSSKPFRLEKLDKSNLFEHEYTITFIANWDLIIPADHNLDIVLSNRTSHPLLGPFRCVLHTWFDSQSITIIGDPEYKEIDSQLEEWISGNMDSFKEMLVKAFFVQAGKYEENNRGQDADDFFSPYENRKYELILGDVTDHPILIFQKLTH